MQKLITQIQQQAKFIKNNIRIMEVCGGHTHAIFQFGLRSLLPSNIKLISGPGCPVCVTSRSFIDKAITYSKMPNTIICTFGDLIRVPGSISSLEKQKVNGADIQIVLNPFQSIETAKQNSNKTVIFLGIGFETTAPGTALAIKQAQEQNLQNFLVLSSHKVMPPAMQALVDEGAKIDGYIAPGHVSTITGTDIFKFIPQKYQIPVVVSGFEALDILESISIILDQIIRNSPKVEIQYKRAVTKQGNKKAQQVINEVFELQDNWWRGLGNITNSGYRIRNKYEKFDIEKIHKITVRNTIEPKNCICGEILKGTKTPNECPLFGTVCKPDNPIGSCMVSNEGTCAAYFKYNDANILYLNPNKLK